MQAKWQEGRIFEMNAPVAGSEEATRPSYLCTFPFPYMNGRLHLGHTFTLSKVEFAAGYERMKGKNVLFPFGFHATGMPIKAAADKLNYELKTFGNPPVFGESEVNPNIRIYSKNVHAAVTYSKKAKATSKNSGSKWQWQIMVDSDVPESDIANFSDAKYWLDYFPRQGVEDMRMMGLKVDWRRSFLTTDLNPYFDSFVRWQFWRLKDSGKIKFGKRHTIYAPKDRGACLDHDRQTGEGVVPVEYTLIKQKLLEPYPTVLEPLSKLGKEIFLVPATLRPETMYGQTNCWVLPTGQYGAFDINDNDIFICTEQAARNLSYQFHSPEWGKSKSLLSFTGQDLIGSLVHAPLSRYGDVYILPMLSVLAHKGTGIVTSVPNQSPDDYVAFRDLVQKPEFRKKYGVADHMVLPFKITSIMYLPGLGDHAAQKVVDDLKIRSQNDRLLLDRAKEEVYLKGFYEGILTVGPYAGSKVEEVKSKICQEMILSNQALKYYEPTSEVLSRSGDVCVVALIDQWYLDYGESEWRKLAEKCLQRMNCYDAERKHLFEKSLAWISQWACSRSYGLGSRIPWDEQFLIESLSDSTIYMAYYTIAHFLHSDLHGQVPGSVQITADCMTPEIWDFIFRGVALSSPTSIPMPILEAMRREFLYWYPLDLRVSGKDLVNNHLTFMIYNHVALFDELQWPRAVRVNGHVMLNKAKMSKSTGNFITLREGVERFTADGMRFALADAGDSLDDANFASSAADSALLKLYAQYEWIKNTLDEKDGLRVGTFNIFDQIFNAQISVAIEKTDTAFGKMEYKEGVKTCFFDLQDARDSYQDMLKTQGGDMHYDLVLRFIRIQVLLISPICPHWADYIWTVLLNEPHSILHEKMPELDGPIDYLRLEQHDYFERNIHSWRLRIQGHMHPKKGQSMPAPHSAVIKVARRYPVWHEQSIILLHRLYEVGGQVLPTQDVLLQALRDHPTLSSKVPQVMPLLRSSIERFAIKGVKVFDMELGWNELEVLETMRVFICRSLGLSQLTIEWSDEAATDSGSNNSTKNKNSLVIPGTPVFHIVIS